ncbi:hypothetical protein MRX96_040989 [Rhipicephalus microplus]
MLVARDEKMTQKKMAPGESKSASPLIPRLFAAANEIVVASEQNATGCSRFEALLADTLNTSVDPCHDFKAYVSSRWLPDPSKELDEHWRYDWDVKYAWGRMVVDEIRLHRHTSPLERLIFDSFEACAHRLVA